MKRQSGVRKPKAKAPARPVGRPPKFSEDEIRDTVIPRYLDYCKKGYSDKAIAGKFEVAHDYWLELAKKNVEFSEAVKKGSALRESFFYEFGMSAFTDKCPKNFNPTMFIWISRNMCRWRNGENLPVETPDEGEKGADGDVTFRAKFDE